MIKILKKLNSPQKIQDYLDKLPFNFEKEGETYYSPLKIIEARKAHCFEGACLAVACLHLNKQKAYILDLKTGFRFRYKDDDHTVALFKQGGLWGAISKTNHSVLRWRDPIYKSVRELAASYFHEYFLEDGIKTLVSFSAPFDIIGRFGFDWVVSLKSLKNIAEALDKSKHFPFYPFNQTKFIKKASKTEIKASMITEW